LPIEGDDAGFVARRTGASLSLCHYPIFDMADAVDLDAHDVAFG
jgi:hypothetical protein